jgi:hypothetical protein
MRGVAVLGFLVAVAPITATPGASLTSVCVRRRAESDVAGRAADPRPEH